jgi:cytochrome c oxidase subunit 1
VSTATTTPSALTPPMRTPGFLGALISTDHKRIGLNLGIMSLIFFVVGGIFALIMRAQLFEPNNSVVSDNSYNALFTMHGSTMIYLFVTPMALALATYLVPLQIGSPQISLPRFTLAGFWIWLCGGIIMQSGWFTSNGPGRAGWSAYAPLSNGQRTPGVGMDLWVIGAGLAVLGMLMIGWAVTVTILRRRAPGMGLLRMPVFTWTALVSVLMVVGAFPVLVFAMALLYANRLGVPIFQGFTGTIDWQDLFWFFGHPVVYVMFFPYLGCAAEAIATNAHKRWFGYKAFVASMLSFAALSMSVWGHHMFITGGVVNQYFAFSSTMLVIPAGIEYFDCVGTLWGSSARFRTAMLFGLGFFIQFLIGGLSGIFIASPVLDYNSYGDYIVVAHFHYTLFAGSIFGFFAGVYHWFPKVTGARLREGLGKIHFVLLVIGTNLTFGPMFILGEDGMTRRIARYPTNPQWATLNQIESIGAGIIALAILSFLINVAVSLRRREVAGEDPWRGHTLEWWTSSPPPPHNFDRPLPPIRSYAPLKDLQEQLEDATADEEQKAPA